MNKEKLTRREFLAEAGAWLWTAAAYGSLVESGIRYEKSKQNVDNTFPDLDERSKRILILEMFEEDGGKNTAEVVILVGYLAAIFIAGFKSPSIIMNR